MRRFVVIFANYYLAAYDGFRDGRIPSTAWTLTFEAAQQWWPTVLQHLLLGMNAHINLDLGIAAACAAPGDRIADLKGGFDRINALLADQVEEVLAALAQISPLLGVLNKSLGPTSLSPSGRRDQTQLQSRCRRTRTGEIRLQRLGLPPKQINHQLARRVHPVGPRLEQLPFFALTQPGREDRPLASVRLGGSNASYSSPGVGGAGQPQQTWPNRPLTVGEFLAPARIEASYDAPSRSRVGSIPARAGRTCGRRSPRHVLRAHPRWSGEASVSALVRETSTGASPWVGNVFRAHTFDALATGPSRGGGVPRRCWPSRPRSGRRRSPRRGLRGTPSSRVGEPCVGLSLPVVLAHRADLQQRGEQRAERRETRAAPPARACCTRGRRSSR